MHTILYVSTHTEMGGAQHSFLDVIRTVDTARFRPVAVVNNRGELFQRLEQLKVDTEVIPFTTPLPFIQILNPLVWLRNIIALVRMSSLASRRSVSLIHCNDGAALYFIGLAKILHGVPVLFHVRWFEEGVRKALVFFAVRRWVDRIVTNSAAVRTYVQQALPGSRIDVSVVYNAVDTNIFHPLLPKNGLRDELRLPDRQQIVGMVGRFVSWKNHALFIRMARRFRDGGNAVAFCLIGAAQFKRYTPNAERLRQSLLELIRQEGLEGEVYFLGYRADIERAVAGLDVLVCPSENEPFGRVVIEAMACGVPVVAANSGGIPEIITHGVDGLLVPVNDEAALVDCLKQLIADRALRQRLSAAGRTTVEQRFSLRHLQQALHGVYNELLTD
ncbi:MAG: glycosyltransferase family 4 protein [Bacteroidota bacterium]